MLTPIKKQGDEHIYILLQFDIIDWIPVCYVDIRRFVWMLISSEITGNHQKLPEFTCGEALSILRLLLRLGVGFRLQSLSSRKPAMISSTWLPFQECLENMRKVETGGVVGLGDSSLDKVPVIPTPQHFLHSLILKVIFIMCSAIFVCQDVKQFD